MNNSKIKNTKMMFQIRTCNKQINNLFSMFLLTITAIVMAHDKGWISINLQNRRLKNSIYYTFNLFYSDHFY